MDFGEAVASGFRNGFNFRGRACRKEFWYTQPIISVLFFTSGGFVSVAFIDTSPGSYVLAGLFSLLVLYFTIISLSITVRRLHDTDKSGWLYLINFIPFASLALLYWFCLAGSRGSNSYGTNPLEPFHEVF